MLSLGAAFLGCPGACCDCGGEGVCVVGGGYKI